MFVAVARAADPIPFPGLFHPAVQTWLGETFAAPTRAQAEGWPEIVAGRSTLILAPTGSGKTLAAFLAAIDRLMFSPVPAKQARCRVLYISPLRALAFDVERNLRAPLVGIARVAERRGDAVHVPTVALRTGDTEAGERARMARTPPDILITTPESLYLLLTSQARAILQSVELVIVDEIHTLAGTKRGAHLALSLERLAHLCGRPIQRVGLSATQRPLDEVARFLGGGETETGEGGSWVPRPVSVVDAGVRKAFDLRVEVPVEDMSRLGEAIRPDQGEIPEGPTSVLQRHSIWPAIFPRLLELIQAHRSTIVFVNSRRLAERVAGALNELAGAEIAQAHHGSIAREQRVIIEDRLKAGLLPAMVATSSLELGIDMGAVDLVVQIETPPSVASGLQRIGRAGHQVEGVSRGVIFPKYRGDLLSTAAITRAMDEGRVEETRVPRNPLDVLTQQIVAMCAVGEWRVDDLHQLVRQAAPFATLSRGQLEGVLDMLSGRYPADELAELRPRITWDRLNGTVRAREGLQRLVVVNAGTIPDRGLYGVFLADGASVGAMNRAPTRDDLVRARFIAPPSPSTAPPSPSTAPPSPSTAPPDAAVAPTGVPGVPRRRGAGRRVGELDEEMVFESRQGDVVVLGASSWRVVEITRDRVLVEPAPGEPGRMPFWRGDRASRPVELGEAIGRLTRELTAMPKPAARTLLTERHSLDPRAADNLLAYLEDQRTAIDALPDDRTIVIERTRDELGDWRICLLSPWGGRVHAPWALALQAKLRAADEAARDDHSASTGLGLEADTIWSDDGIVVRLPDRGAVPDTSLFLPDPDEIEDLVVRELGGSALFAAHFREAAGRALLIPRQRPGQRAPLWMQRKRAADLLAVASRFGSFPIVLETFRECLQDVFDLPALVELARRLRRRDLRVVTVDAEAPSPFAASLLFGYVANYIYDGDAPLAERRAQALAVDQAQLRELLGAAELRELLDGAVLEEIELGLQGLTPGHKARSPDRLHDLLLRIGDLSLAEIEARTEEPGARSQEPEGRERHEEEG
ncbi:MAG: DEAD/DEAH box helicase, partial [Chloroflexota bacterium]